ncbi:MAG: hypothetical protein CL908_02535 [Deltaproteobacteria bacterium]|nr:hypothetical protein [Deltaproteobacteria bacterium]
MGQKVARTLVIDLPGLGQLDRRRICSLAGLAPYPRDSGQEKGIRLIHGGRAALSAILYLAAMVGSRCSPELMAMKARLQGAGKPPRVILIAVARRLLAILNAIVGDQTEWKTMTVWRSLPTHWRVLCRTPELQTYCPRRSNSAALVAIISWRSPDFSSPSCRPIAAPFRKSSGCISISLWPVGVS